MKIHRLAIALPLLLVGCGVETPIPDPTTTGPAPATSAETTPEPSPTSTFEVAPSVIESPNTDEEWDDWGVDDPLPPIDEGQGLVQLVRMDLTDPEALDVHVRLGIPAELLEAPEGEEVTFCQEEANDPEVVGFGNNWEITRSERDGYVVCDTEGTFPLDEWGDPAAVAAPTLTDGVWDVDFQQAFIPEQTVALYRFRLEFGGPVLEAGEGGRLDGDAVTWHGPAAITATAESGE